MYIKPFDCINNHKNKFINFCDSYLYLDGISNKLGYRKFSVYQEKNDIIRIKEENQQPHHWKLTAKTIVKIFSYIIFPFLLIIALIGKAHSRKTHSYRISRNKLRIEIIRKDVPKTPPVIENMYIVKLEPAHPQEEKIILPVKIPKNLDIRGKTWLDTENFYIYAKYLGSKYPNLFVNLIPGNTIIDIDNAVLLDGHFENKKCNHTKEGFDCKDKTIFPYAFHVSKNHWALVLLDKQKRTLEYYDSMKNYGNYDQIIECLKNLTKVLTEKDPSGTPYQFDCKIKKKLQQDTYQCGVWLLYFLENRLKNPNVDFNDLDIEKAQEMIANYRLRVMAESIKWDKKENEELDARLA